MASRMLTFLFIGIDDSTAMSQRLGDAYDGVVADFRQLIGEALAAQGGEEVATRKGDFLAVFASPLACVHAAIQVQRAMASHAWPAGENVGVRMGIDSGAASPTAETSAGMEGNGATRIAAVAHGRQVVVSAAVAGLLADSLPAGIWLRDLGRHWLNGLNRADRIFQLQADDLSAAIPPLRPLHDPNPRSNLPAQVSSFIGRDIELAKVHALVRGSRLVTLTGAGGAGKTRLALQVAARLGADARDGVWFVDLAPLADPDLVAVTVADVLGIRFEPTRPALDTLAEAIDAQRLLVLLDNCEHVIGACAMLADALLRGCPNLAFLATSREPLGIGGERMYRVPSLGIPADGDDAGAIRASEAVRLLEDRATGQGVALTWDEPSAELAGRICRRLDGIPLAVELAAARLRVMPAAELDARLDERFGLLTGGSRAALPRQQTLRAMVDWSWELLTGGERAVLARLSVFAGGFGLAAAEAVAAGPDVPGGEVVGYLGALVDKSLVQFGDAGAGLGRYRLLETVRQYAAGQLDALGPAAAQAARAAHLDYYLALAEAAAPQLAGADQAAWLDRLDGEMGNLRAAIAVSLSQPDPEPGLRLAASLRVFWRIRGHAAEGAGALRALLDAPTAQGPTMPRARALATAGYLLEATGGLAMAAAYCEKALTIARAAGDERLVADLLQQQAWAAVRQGQPGAAQTFIEQGLGRARRLGDPLVTGRLLSARSYAAYVAGNPEGATRDAVEALRLFRQTADRLQVGSMLGNLGNYELSAGDLDSARRHMAESLDIARALNSRDDVVYATFNLGLAEYLAHSPDAARTLFAESFDLARRMGMKTNMVYALLGLAMAGDANADPGWSARLHGSADQGLADLAETIAPLEGQLAELDREQLRAAMGTEAFEAEYAAGRALGLTGALAALEREDTAAEQERVAAVSDRTTSVLTPRELDVLTLVAQGLSNPDIAERLVLSEHTVKRHLANILRKLNISSRAAAAAWGVRTGLV